MFYLLALIAALVVAGSQYECKDPDCTISTVPKANNGRRDR